MGLWVIASGLYLHFTQCSDFFGKTFHYHFFSYLRVITKPTHWIDNNCSYWASQAMYEEWDVERGERKYDDEKLVQSQGQSGVNPEGPQSFVKLCQIWLLAPLTFSFHHKEQYRRQMRTPTIHFAVSYQLWVKSRFHSSSKQLIFTACHLLGLLCVFTAVNSHGLTTLWLIKNSPLAPDCTLQTYYALNWYICYRNRTQTLGFLQHHVVAAQLVAN